MTDYERAKQLSEKITFSDWEWLQTDLATPISENAARVVIMELIRDKAFVTWDAGGEICVLIGPLMIKFNKSGLELEDEPDTTGNLVGDVEIELNGNWQ